MGRKGVSPPAGAFHYLQVLLFFHQLRSCGGPVRKAPRGRTSRCPLRVLIGRVGCCFPRGSGGCWPLLVAGEPSTQLQALLGGLFLSPGSCGPRGLWSCLRTTLGLTLTSGCHRGVALGQLQSNRSPLSPRHLVNPEAAAWGALGAPPRRRSGGGAQHTAESSLPSALLLRPCAPARAGSQQGASPRSVPFAAGCGAGSAACG